MVFTQIFWFYSWFQKAKNVHFRLAEVKKILTVDKKILTDSGSFDYDVLVIATGADTNFFGNQQLIDHAFPMKSTVLLRKNWKGNEEKLSVWRNILERR